MEIEALTPIYEGDEGTNDTSATATPSGGTADGEGGAQECATDAEAVGGKAEGVTAEGDEEGSLAEAEDAESIRDGFARLESEDAAVLAAHFPSLFSGERLTGLHNPVRYGELREAGLSPVEAFCASHYEQLVRPTKRADTRAHLESCVMRSSAPGGERMSAAELYAARDLFPSLSDSEIEGLYHRAQHGKNR